MPYALSLGDFSRYGPDCFAPSHNVPAFAGISGGRTSALMAALLDSSVTLLFQNTGREHPRTYDFLHELDHALGGRIIWLEFRPPLKKGDRPREFRTEVVSYTTAARDGSPFEEAMQALADFRATKGKPPIAPWARSRICTSYLKHKTQDRYIKSLGVSEWDQFVGLRHDEPGRVSKLRGRSSQTTLFRVPLFEVGITKQDVGQFWARQSFDLGLDDYQGNCTGCFLKDQGDLSRALAEPETDASWWINMADTYPRFGGQNFVGYSQLLEEYPQRRLIEDCLRQGQPPISDGSVSPRRFKLLVKQEHKRLVEGSTPWSCSCEQAEALVDAGSDAEEAFVLSLPG